MELSEDRAPKGYQIKAYAPGEIQVNENSYTHSLIISAETLITDWRPQSLTDLKVLDWQIIIDLAPEVVLLGTGLTFKVPPAALLAPLYQNNIGVEFMDTGAACRTYIVLASENRTVIAALLIT